MTNAELEAAIDEQKGQILTLAQEYAGREKGVTTKECVQVIHLAFVAAARGDPESSIKAWTPGEGPFKAYAMLAATWMLKAHLRGETSHGMTMPRTQERANVTTRSLQDVDYKKLVAPPQRPSEPTFPPDFWHRIENAVEPRQWECLSLQFRQGMSQTDIATQLNVTPATVSLTVQRGLANIKKNMPEASELLPDSREP